MPVAVADAVTVGTGDDVAETVAVAVAVGVGVRLGVGVGEAVAVGGRTVGVAVGAGTVAVRVGVRVGSAPELDGSVGNGAGLPDGAGVGESAQRVLGAAQPPASATLAAISNRARGGEIGRGTGGLSDPGNVLSRPWPPCRG